MKQARYERYVELVQITEVRDGCTFRTRSLGCGWFTDEVIDGNRPRDTNVMYVAADDVFARNNMTTRRAPSTGNQRRQ